MTKFYNKIKTFIMFIIKNKFVFTIIFFVVWILFLDTYNIIDRIKNLKKLQELKQQAEFFRKEVELYKQQYNELFSTKENLEKFAREQYQLKEEDEDVFIIVDD